MALLFFFQKKVMESVVYSLG